MQKILAPLAGLTAGTLLGYTAFKATTKPEAPTEIKKSESLYQNNSIEQECEQLLSTFPSKLNPTTPTPTTEIFEGLKKLNAAFTEKKRQSSWYDRYFMLYEENNFLESLFFLLKNAPYKDDVEVVSEVFIAIRDALRASRNLTNSVQKKLWAMEGADFLLNYVLDSSMPATLRAKAAAALRAATYVKYFKESEGIEYVKRIVDSHAQTGVITKLAAELKPESGNQFSINILSILFHIALVQEGAKILSLIPGIMEKLIFFTTQPAAQTTTAIFTIATICMENVYSEGHILLGDYQRICDKISPNTKPTKRAGDMIYAIVTRYLVPGNEDEKSKTFAKRAIEPTPEYIAAAKLALYDFLLKSKIGALLSSSNPEGRQRAYAVKQLVTSKDFWNEGEEGTKHVEIAAAYEQNVTPKKPAGFDINSLLGQGGGMDMDIDYSSPQFQEMLRAMGLINQQQKQQ